MTNYRKRDDHGYVYLMFNPDNRLTKIQMTEEQFDEFYRDCIPEMFYNVVKINAKSKGYIIKSPAEEAEEMYKVFESECIDKNDMIELTKKLYQAIQYQKSEIERLKGE